MSETADHWRRVLMRDWPPGAFEQLGLRNPYEPGNLRFRREALIKTRHLGGAIVECGVYQGQGLATLAWLMREVDDKRSIFGFDSFKGSPEPTSYDMVGGKLVDSHLPDYFANTSAHKVHLFLKSLDLDNNIRLIPGFFHETLPRVAFSISVLILDCDLYESYKVCLSNLYPKLQKGGWIIFDEYFSPKYPGARIAIDEFFTDKPEKPTLAYHLLADDSYERWHVIKT